MLEKRPVQSQSDGDVQKVHTSPWLAMVNHIHNMLEKEQYKTGGAACEACGDPQWHRLLIIPEKRPKTHGNSECCGAASGTTST